MAINFPDSPSVDDVFTSGDRQWKWNGTSWQSIVAGESDPTMGGDLSGTASTAQIIADAVAGTFDRFDIFANIKPFTIPGQHVFCRQMVGLGMLYYALKDKL